MLETWKEKYEGRMKLSAEMMNEHLIGWTLAWNRCLKSNGKCSHTKKIIYVSKYHIEFSSLDEFKNTILHEIAHALAGHKAGHGPEWVRIAKEIGCDGQRLCKVNPSKKEYIDKKTVNLICPCGYAHVKRLRVTRALLSKVCKKCKGPLTISK
jgi:predicted SprT family Zn-dependent metalloprotease